MRNHLYEFFKQLWYGRHGNMITDLATHNDTPVHTQVDDYLDTCPNSRVDVLDENEGWTDLAVVDEKGIKSEIKQEEAKVPEKQEEVVVVTESKKKRKKKR